MHEYTPNYKILQQSFEKCGILKFVDVEKLQKGKPQDNLEFLQWIKRYYDIHYKVGTYYDAVERRNGEELYVAESKLKLTSKSLQLKFKKNNSNENVKKVDKRANQNIKDSNTNNAAIESKKENMSQESNSKRNEVSPSINNLKFLSEKRNQINIEKEIIVGAFDKNLAPRVQINDSSLKESHNYLIVNNQARLVSSVGKLNIHSDNKDNFHLNRINLFTKPQENVIRLTEEFEIVNNKNELKELKNENFILKKCLSDIGRERDFYLSKLRNIEYTLLKVSNNEINNDTMDILSHILYNTTDLELCVDDKGLIKIKK